MLGQPAAHVWPEIWPDLVAIADEVMATGRTVYHTDASYFIETSAQKSLLETFVDWSYVPVADEQGNIPGFFNLLYDCTTITVAARRQQLIHELQGSHKRQSLDQVCDVAVKAFEARPEDIPFAASRFDSAESYADRPHRPCTWSI
jgi:hypothetical protein